MTREDWLNFQGDLTIAGLRAILDRAETAGIPSHTLVTVYDSDHCQCDHSLSFYWTGDDGPDMARVRYPGTSQDRSALRLWSGQYLNAEGEKSWAEEEDEEP